MSLLPQASKTQACETRWGEKKEKKKKAIRPWCVAKRETVIPQILILWLSLYLVSFNIELRYHMCVHSKMRVDNFVMLQIDEKIKVLVSTI